MLDTCPNCGSKLSFSDWNFGYCSNCSARFDEDIMVETIKKRMR